MLSSRPQSVGAGCVSRPRLYSRSGSRAGSSGLCVWGGVAASKCTFFSEMLRFGPTAKPSAVPRFFAIWGNVGSAARKSILARECRRLAQHTGKKCALGTVSLSNWRRAFVSGCVFGLCFRVACQRLHPWVSLSLSLRCAEEGTASCGPFSLVELSAECVFNRQACKREILSRMQPPVIPRIAHAVESPWSLPTA